LLFFISVAINVSIGVVRIFMMVNIVIHLTIVNSVVVVVVVVVMVVIGFINIIVVIVCGGYFY